VDAEKIRTEYVRNLEALKLRPSIGQCTSVSKIWLRDNLVCDLEAGPWTLTAASKSGDSEAGPSPGVFGHTALGSCPGLSASFHIGPSITPRPSLSARRV
jgi:hypothetical protein